MALAGRRSMPRLLARIRDFERPEHAPQSPAGTHTCAVVDRRPPWCPAEESTRKNPRPPEKQRANVQKSAFGTAGEKCAAVHKKCIWYVPPNAFFFFTWVRFSPAPVGLFSRFWLRGTREAHRYITTHVWIPAELRGTCSGRSNSRNLASKR